MYDRLGLGWGNSVLGFIALAFGSVPWLFFKYGETLRNIEEPFVSLSKSQPPYVQVSIYLSTKEVLFNDGSNEMT